MSTAQPLIALSDRLTAMAEAIDIFVANHVVPDGPTDPVLARLQQAAARIAVEANALGQAGIEALADDVGQAIDDLGVQVGQARHALARIDAVERAFDIAGAVLGAAAKCATSVASGNWVGAASSVIALAQAVQTTLGPTPATA